ncbi:ROK family transcriptional regulator [Cohnella hongkongensis]|uniref:ROK family protein n=1 Tax=Cohnella hongkongensis TaxID=178337 RepID=A0ABV9F6H2_9BACL
MGMKLSDQKGSKAAILQVLRIYGSISRIALTQTTGLSRATVSISISELIDAGLVREIPNREFTVGRPATSLELVSHTRAILGADLHRNAWTLGAFDLTGNTLKTANIPVSESSPEAAAKQLAREFPDFVNRLDVDPLPFLGLGTPGLVDSERGTILSASDLGWNNVDIGSIMSGEIGWPTVVLNRHRARGLSECRYGMKGNYQNMVYIGIGTGIAAGVFMNGQLFSGSVGGAGEVGHMTMEPDGLPCPCGNTGCLQLYSAEPAIEQEARRLIRMGNTDSIFSDPGFDIQLLKAPDICKAAEEGDAIAASAIRKAATYLGIGMANIVNLYNPDAIILGGAVPSSSRLFVETAARVMQQRAIRPLSNKTEVHASSYNERGGALGAANFALDKLISYSLFTVSKP